MTAKQKVMLKTRMREFHEELVVMHQVIARLQVSLTLVDENTNLTKQIGSFVRDYPKFNDLKPQSDWLKTTIRKICSGELEVQVAHNMLEASKLEIVELMECFNSKVLFDDYYEHTPANPISQD